MSEARFDVVYQDGRVAAAGVSLAEAEELCHSIRVGEGASPQLRPTGAKAKKPAAAKKTTKTAARKPSTSSSRRKKA